MQFKNIHIILSFVTLALHVLSSPIDVTTKDIAKDINDVNDNIVIEVSDDEDTLVDVSDVTLTIEEDSDSELTETETESPKEPIHTIETLIPNNQIVQVEENMFITEFQGDYGLDQLLASNYTSSEKEVLQFILNYMYPDLPLLQIEEKKIELACSSFQVPNENGDGYYFGRNYDWANSPAIVVVSRPTNGYSSISTVSRSPIDVLLGNVDLPDFVLQAIALYGPLDGVNEKGLTISVNMVGDNTKPADQNTEKPEITVTTAIRVILDKAATVDEAIAILEKYDMHSIGIGIEFHYHITDALGNAVVVEYVDDQMLKVYDNVNENFYLTPEANPENYIGYRYTTIKDSIAKKPNMTVADVRDTLSSASQDYTLVYTEWSVIYDQNDIEATYYHHRNYDHGYFVKL